MRVWVRGYPQPGANVFIGVFRRAGVNAVDVAKSVRDLLPSIQSQLPSSVVLFTAYDRSQTIVTSINDVQTTLYIAFALVVMVIFFFLGRATDTLIPAVALPLSLLLHRSHGRPPLQPRQPLVDGSYARHRFPGR